jgi:hypothetical protein
MNSRMRQPKPSGVSLNDCLLKGPPALADLYTVTLGIREHKVAYTKDISKFYQCVEADETAQHVRRILWRFSEEKEDPTIFVTTRVNYRDRPAGCIAIAAVRETAMRFGKGKEKAAWFLKNWMYVGDAAGGGWQHGSSKTGVTGHGRHSRAWRVSIQGNCYVRGLFRGGGGAEKGAGTQRRTRYV